MIHRQRDRHRLRPVPAQHGQRQLPNAAGQLRAVGVEPFPVQEHRHTAVGCVQIQHRAFHRFRQDTGEVDGLARNGQTGEAAHTVRRQGDDILPLLGADRPALLVVDPSLRHGLARPPQGEIVGLLCHGLRIEQQCGGEKAAQKQGGRRCCPPQKPLLHSDKPPVKSPFSLRVAGKFTPVKGLRLPSM